MKPWYVVIIFVGASLIALGVFWGVNAGIFSDQGEIWIPSSGTWGTNDWIPGHWASDTDYYDTPSYTADRVIYIVQAKYPVCYRSKNGVDVQTATSITATYLGGTKAAWKVEVSCPSLYHLNPIGGANSLTVYFWETDSALHNSAR